MLSTLLLLSGKLYSVCGMSPKESYVLILSFPSVWLCQVNSEREETLTNTERPNRAEMEACPDQEAGDRQGLGWGLRLRLPLEKDVACWAGGGGGIGYFKERKEKMWGVSG